MKFKKNWKRFWTLSSAREGFTLVELIVVIAILAILAGVGIPAYSGYVTKANKAADEQLFSDIEAAIHLAYYSNQGTSIEGYITLTSSEASASSQALENAMESAFGSNWRTICFLKYDGWESTAYQNSLFSGNETALLNKVDKLTDELSAVLSESPELVGPYFSEYLAGLGIEAEDNDAVADAAVLYVAQTSKNANIDAAAETMRAIANGEITDLGSALGALQNHYGSTVPAAAALYAMTVSYCEYEKANGNAEPQAKLDSYTFNVDASSDPLVTIATMFYDIYGVRNEDNLKEYFKENGQLDVDLTAYHDILETVNGAQSEILNSGNLGEAGFFSSDTISNMFAIIANGGTLVIADEADGMIYVDHPAKED